MSVEIFGFLGEGTENLKERTIKKFEELGFTIELDPASDLLGFLNTSSLSTLRIAILETPGQLLRLSPHIPFLVELEYYVVPKEKVLSPPKKVQNYSYLAYTRTAAGRAVSSAYIQMLLIATLASISKGKYFGLGDNKIISGDNALKNILTSLNNIEKNYKALLNTYESKKKWTEKNDLLPTINSSINSPYFDEGAIHFIGWKQQYSNSNVYIKNPNKITLKNQNLLVRWFKKLSWLERLGFGLMLYFLGALIISEMQTMLIPK